MKRVNVEQNIFELKVVPNTPKVNRNEQVAMYVPIASNDAPGVASFDEHHFNVDPLTGRVRIKNVSVNSHNVFVKTILKNDINWLKDGSYYKYNILLSEHKLANIVDINVNKKTGTGDDTGYENTIFSYKKYLTGSVAIVLSEPLDIEIIIKGE